MPESSPKAHTKPGNVVDLALPGKRKPCKGRKLRMLRSAVVALLLIIVPIAVLILRDDVNIYGIKGFFTGLFGGESIELSDDFAHTFMFDSDAKSAYGMPKDHVAVLSTTRFTVSSMDGVKNAAVAAPFANPALDTAGPYSLCYDRGGTMLMLFSGTEELYRMNTESPIITACISAKGEFAVATEDKYCKGLLSVYNTDFTLRYKFESLKNYIVDADMWDDGGRMALYTVNTSGGELVSHVLEIDPDSWDLPPETELPGVCVFAIRCLPDGGILAVTDADTRVIAPDGTVHTYSYGGRMLQKFDTGSGEYIALVLGNHLVGNMCELVLLDSACKTVFAKQMDIEIKSVAVNNGNVSVLSTDKLLLYGMDGELYDQREATHNMRVVRLDSWGRLGLFAPGSVSVYGLGQK